MSDLDNAINSINASAAKAENTADFLDDMSTFDDQSSVTNPNNGQTVASIPKQVKDRTDELFADAESDINQAVSDAAQSATDAQDAADSIGRYQGLWPDTDGSADKGDTYQTQVSGTPTGQYFTALQNTTVDPIGDNVNWRSVIGSDLGSVDNGTKLQHRRGTDAEIASGTPAMGELWLNTSETELVVGDGVTLGGVPIPKKSAVNASDSQIAGGSIYPISGDVLIPLGTQTTSVPTSISMLRVATGVDGGELLKLWEPSGDFPSTGHTITDVIANEYSGYDVVTDAGSFEFLTEKAHTYRSNLDSRGWGLVPSPKSDGVPTVNQTAQILKVRDYVKANQVTVNVPAGNVLCDGDALDFKDCTVGGLLGAGVDKTQFYADTDNTLTAWFDLGTTGSDTVPVTSDIQFGSFGGFSLRCNGKNIFRATSHNFFRRGDNNDIRVYDAQRSFFYDYCWLDSFGPMRSQNHTVRGHDFGGASLNALTLHGLEASSNVPNVRDYSFSNPNTVLLVSPDCEGLGGGMYFEDGRSVTLLNAHFESESTKLRTVNSSTNGLCINVVGGASFNSPEFFKMPEFFEALTVTNFSLYDVGPDLTGVLWQINARKVIINNLTVVDSNKVKATRRQVRDWVKASLGTSVDFCSVDGEIIRVNGHNTLVDESDKFFIITTTPGSPVDIDTVVDIVRHTVEITMTQRVNSTTDSAVKILATVDDSLNLTQSEITNIKNATANITLGYNATTKRLTVDSSFGISTKIKIEYWRN
ncbi:coil containing protein [Vibrio phage 1.007.O._10N.261.55.F9]|nr:coil containing protein [Vibrio phage 1.007.O._10N.261.55.F9]